MLASAFNFASVFFLAASVVVILALIHWGVAPLSKRKPARLLASSLGAMCAFFLALICYGWIGWWDTQFQIILRTFTTKAFASFIEQLAYPNLYLLGAWGLGFVVTFHLLGLRRERTDQSDREDDAEQ